MHHLHHSSLKFFVSPSLGGLVDVSLSMVKKWNPENEVLEEDFESVSQNQKNEQLEVDQSEYTREEQEQMGYYNVECILKHKYLQGWRFLTQWEGYPLSAATWEPIKSFRLPGGSLNAQFKAYCEANGLAEILRKALGINSRE